MMIGLWKRAVTAAVLLPVVAFATHLGPAALAGLLALVALLGAVELGRIAKAKGVEPPRWFLGPAAVLLVFSHAGFIRLDVSAALVLITVLVIVVELVRRERKILLDLAVVLLGSLYLGLLPAHLLGFYKLGRVGIDDPLPVYFALALVWGCDTMAYCTGSVIGRHRLLPSVSPSKTWEGAIAGIVGSVALAVGLGGWVDGLSMGGRVLAGILAGVFGQIGDLAESMMKRDAALKDSGRAIPGHGGILDRIDSLILAVPVLYYGLRWIR